MKNTKKNPKVKDMKPKKDAKGGGFHPAPNNPHPAPNNPHPSPLNNPRPGLN